MSDGLFDQIREVVKKIPAGKVLTYGDVATLVGTSDARKVGFALHGNRDASIPCHRIVKKSGYLAESYQSPHDPLMQDESKTGEFNFSNRDEQAILLVNEGVTFAGPYQVDIEKHLAAEMLK